MLKATWMFCSFAACTNLYIIWFLLETLCSPELVTHEISECFLCAGRGAEYCNQFLCLSASISLDPLDRSSQNFLCRSPVAMAQSFSGGVRIPYVLPVLWMMSRLAIMDRMAMHGVALRYRGRVWCLWMPCFFSSQRDLLQLLDTCWYFCDTFRTKIFCGFGM